MSKRLKRGSQHVADPLSPTIGRARGQEETGEEFEDLSLPTNPTKKRVRGTTARGDSSQVLSPTPQDEAGDKTLCVTPIEIEQSPHLKNWKQWAAIKDGLKLTRLADARVPSLVPTRLNGMLSTVQLTDRDWQLVDCEHYVNQKLPRNKNTFPDYHKVAGGYWRILVKNSPVQKQIETPRRTAWIPDGILPADDKNGAEAVGRELCNILNHLPLARVSLLRTDPTAQALIMSAVHRAQNRQDELASLVTHDVIAQLKFSAFNVNWKNKSYWATLLTYNNEIEPQPDTTRIRIFPSEVGTARVIPDLPASLISAMPKVGSAPTPKDNADKASLERALKLCRYIQYVMFGACGEKQLLVEQAYHVASLFTVSKTVDKVTKIYDAGPLFKLKKHATCVSIELSGTAERDIAGGTVPHIDVVGCSKARVSVILDDIVEAFLDGCNILDAWQAGVLKADKVNKMPAETVFTIRCTHTEEERSQKFHVCRNCNAITLCDEIRYDPDARLHLCLQCEATSKTAEIEEYLPFDSPRPSKSKNVATRKEDKFIATGIKAPVVPDVGKESGQPGSRLRRGLLGELRKYDFPGKPSDTIVARQEHIRRFMDRFLDQATDTWCDGYSNARRPDKPPPTIAKVLKSGLLGSMDAALPFYVDQGKVWLYHENNMVATAAYENQAANTWLKTNLQILRDALGLRDSEDYNAYHDINNRFDHAWAIRTKYPHKAKRRLEIIMDDHEFARCRKEIHKGILEDSNELVPFAIHKKNLRKPLWTAKDRERINGLIDQMIARKAPPIALPRGSDSAPFPWRPEHMPDDWSWSALEAHMAYHFELLDMWCDKQWDLDEIPETLFLELVWQWIDNGGRDPWWRLPMTPIARHAAGYAMAHIRHGARMDTRWPNDVVIQDIAQRNDSRCNMVIEPRIVNLLKMKYGEEEYDVLLNDLLQNLKDETEWFARPTQPLPALRIYSSTLRVYERAAMWVQQDEDDAEFSGNDFLDVSPDEILDDFKDEPDVDVEEVEEDDESEEDLEDVDYDVIL